MGRPSSERSWRIEREGKWRSSAHCLPSCAVSCFLFLRHPIAEIYRPRCLQPSWYRDAVVLIGYTERLEQLYIDNRIPEMAPIFELIAERFNDLEYMATRQNVMVELPPRLERRLRSKTRLFKFSYDNHGRLLDCDLCIFI